MSRIPPEERRPEGGIAVGDSVGPFFNAEFVYAAAAAELAAAEEEARLAAEAVSKGGGGGRGSSGGREARVGTMYYILALASGFRPLFPN